MDLLATVKKEGSRGGTGDFKWSDVQTSSHREHYLGHSLMAPVGRWQKNRDLGWYAKGDAADPDNALSADEQAARQRAEEIKKVKEAEQDALARALGLPVPDRSNPNTQALGNRRDMETVAKATAGEDGGGDGGKGLGYGRPSHGPPRRERSEEVERIEGNAEQQDNELDYALKEYKRRHGDEEPRRRRRSRSRDRDREHRQRPRDREREGHHHHHRRRRRSTSHARGNENYRRRSPTAEQSRASRRDRSRSPRRRDSDRRDPRKH